MSMVMPIVQELAGDSSHYVRSSLAGVVLELAPKLGKISTLETLLPVCLSLLRDEYPEVRLAVISKLDYVSQASLCDIFSLFNISDETLDDCFYFRLQVIGIELITQSLLPAIEELAEDKHWRVRLAIISHIPLLASQVIATLKFV